MAKKVFQRLEQMRMVNHLADLRSLPGHWEQLTGDRKGQFSVRLNGPHRLIFIPNGNREEYIENNEIKWEKVFSVEVIEIVNYHE